MSLRDAVQDVINNMEEDKDDADNRGIVFEPEEVSRLIQAYIRSLKSALKASENEQPVILQATGAKFDPDEQLIKLQARRQQEEYQHRSEAEESFAPIMVELVGGNSDGDHIQIDSRAMVPGGRTPVAGEVYCYNPEDKKFHYDEESTKKFVERMRK